MGMKPFIWEKKVGDVIEKCILEAGLDEKRLAMVKMVMEDYLDWIDCEILWKLFYEDDGKFDYLFQF